MRVTTVSDRRNAGLRRITRLADVCPLPRDRTVVGRQRRHDATEQLHSVRFLRWLQVQGQQRYDALCEDARKRMRGRFNHLIDPAAIQRRLDRSRSQSPQTGQEAIERSREEVPRLLEAGGCRVRKSRNRKGRRRIETWQRWPTPRPTEPPANHAAPPRCPCNETWKHPIRRPQPLRRWKTRHGDPCGPMPLTSVRSGGRRAPGRPCSARRARSPGRRSKSSAHRGRRRVRNRQGRQGRGEEISLREGKAEKALRAVALALAISFVALRASIAIGARTRADDVSIASEVRKGTIADHTRRFKCPAGEDIREQDQHAHRGHDLTARRAMRSIHASVISTLPQPSPPPGQAPTSERMSQIHHYSCRQTSSSRLSISLFSRWSKRWLPRRGRDEDCVVRSICHQPPGREARWHLLEIAPDTMRHYVGRHALWPVRQTA